MLLTDFGVKLYIDHCSIKLWELFMTVPTAKTLLDPAVVIGYISMLLAAAMDGLHPNPW